MKKCPYCQEAIQDTAVKCRYCGEWLNKQGEPSSNKNVHGHKITTSDVPSPKQSYPLENIKQSEPNIDNYRTQEKISLWNWKSFIIAFLIAFLLNIILAGITDAKPHKNIVWTVCWIYLTIEAWKYWQWKALLPFPLYFFVLTIGFLFLKSAGVEFHSIPVAILVIISNIGGLVIFYMLLNRARNSVMSETYVNYVNEGTEIENIIREAELQPAQGVSKVAQSESKVKQQDEEFIALLQSSIEENELNIIPENELIKIYNRAKSIASANNETNIELSTAINALSDELNKRGLNQEHSPQKNLEYEESLLIKPADKERSRVQVLFAILAAIIIPLILYVIIGFLSNISNW